MANSKLKIAVLGTRGFPDVQGGVEAHCANLYPRLVEKGCEVIVFTRKPYVDLTRSSYRGVKLVPLSCPKNRFLEAIVHTFKGILEAGKIKPDILHIHAIGPSILTPFARILGMKCVVTNHGPDYMRKKWNKFARFVLRLGEFLGMRFAGRMICVSPSVRRGKMCFIPNGVDIPEARESEGVLRRFGLEKGKYILAVGRFVPEKGFGDIIEAYTRINTDVAWKLVIVGDADHPDKYSLGLKEKAAENSDIILTGFLTGEPLEELYSHAGLFVLPSYYEGLPIVLLEALSYGLSCIASDIPANRDVGLLAEERFFKVGDVEALAGKIKEFVGRPLTADEKKRQLSGIAGKYDWGRIAEKTLEVYRGAAALYRKKIKKN